MKVFEQTTTRTSSNAELPGGKRAPFEIELATPGDDAAIRQLLATNPVPGRVSLTYEREPSYFLGSHILGQFSQVLVARCRQSGEVVGIASRATRPLFVNGHAEDVGYLSQLRVAEQHRGRWLVSHGFRTMHQLHQDGRVAGYLATITDENVRAQGVLVERPRRHFPIFRHVEEIYTGALILRPCRVHSSGPYKLQQGSRAELDRIIGFLTRHGPEKQFFPAYQAHDFGAAAPGFSVEDFVVAYQGTTIVGVVGLWDQSSYKQTVVQSYSGALRWMRSGFNLGLRLMGAQPLPVPGRPIRFAYASFICVAENNPDIFRSLLQRVYALAARRQYAYLMVGLAACDPLLPVVQEYLHIPYRSRLYTVCWRDGAEFHERLDNRVPYVEIAAL